MENEMEKEIDEITEKWVYEALTMNPERNELKKAMKLAVCEAYKAGMETARKVFRD